MVTRISLAVQAEEIYEIFVIFDVAKRKVVELYSPNKHIVTGGQGTKELEITVTAGSQLRWRAITAASSNKQGQTYGAIISQVRIYKPAGSYLVDWSLLDKPSHRPVFPAYTESKNIHLKYNPNTKRRESIKLPQTLDKAWFSYVQCSATIPHGGQIAKSPKLSYSFCITPYIDGKRQNDVCFDPYIYVKP